MAGKKKVEDEEPDADPVDGDAQHGVTKDENALDETVSGGRYKVGGKLVNSEGEELKK